MKLIYEIIVFPLKIQVSRNNLQVYKVRIFICLVELSSMTLSWVITVKMIFLQCYTSGVILEEEQPFIE